MFTVLRVHQVAMKTLERVSSYVLIGILGVILLGTAFFAPPSPPENPYNHFAAAASVSSPYVYTWNANGVLNEAGSMSLSSSPYWWVNSGAKLVIQGGYGQTIQGALPSTDYWRLTYALSNPTDTDNGYHPQNIFRLLTRSTWDNVRITMPLKIAMDNLSVSPNRNASNGLLFMSRYKDNGQTLYYSGIRVDGYAIIKKKYRGTYYTMAQKKVFDGTYSRTAGTGVSQNLLPHDEFINLRSETVTNADGSVTVRLYMQRQGETTWTLLVSAIDDGTKYGGTPTITGSLYIGARTDFMDVLFGTFRAETIFS